MVCSDHLKIAIAQLCSVDDIRVNLSCILDLLEKSDKEKYEIVFFPENSLYLRVKEGDTVPEFSLNDHCFQILSQWCKNNNKNIHFGSVPLKINSQFYNSSIFIDVLGVVSAQYQKIHLFDVDVEGLKSIRESDVFTYGNKPSIFEFKGWKIAESICYDVRFSELYRLYNSLGAEIILVPAAFLVPTGQAHWEILLRARAIENQCFVVASAQAGEHKGAQINTRELKRNTYGHSMVIGPWGEVISLNKIDVGLRYAELKKEQITKVREQIPMTLHRKNRIWQG